MANLVKRFLKEEEGMGTVEMVIIIAVLVTIAIIFRKAIVDWVTNTVSSVFSGASDGASTSTKTTK